MKKTLKIDFLKKYFEYQSIKLRLMLKDNFWKHINSKLYGNKLGILSNGLDMYIYVKMNKIKNDDIKYNENIIFIYSIY